MRRSRQMRWRWLGLAVMAVMAVMAGCGRDTEASETDMVSAAISIEAPRQENEAVEERVYEYRVNPDNYLIQPIAGSNPDVVLLTFDDSPQQPDSCTLVIAETLAAKGAGGIFFVMGQFLEREGAREIIKKVSDMGFEVGNHSYSHADFHTLTRAEQLEEITRTNDAVEAITGERPRFFRAPYGLYNADTLALMEELGMTMMNWTYGYDWEPDYMQGPALAEIMVETPYLGSGANLLMHDRPWTAEAIGAIIDGLRAKGYEMVDPALIESPE